MQRGGSLLWPEVFALSPLTGNAELLDPDQLLDAVIRQAAAFYLEKCILIAEEPKPSA